MAKTCPLRLPPGVRESDQVDVYRVENHLDRHQDNYDVAARQHADSADQQEGRAQHQVINGRNGMHRQILFLAITTEPTTATSSRMEATSNGSRKLRKQRFRYHFGIAKGRVHDLSRGPPLGI